MKHLGNKLKTLSVTQTTTVMITVGFHQTFDVKMRRLKMGESSILRYLSLSDGTIEWRHREAITVWTHAKLQAPEQIQAKVLYSYLDSVQKGKQRLLVSSFYSLFPVLNSID